MQGVGTWKLPASSSPVEYAGEEDTNSYSEKRKQTVAKIKKLYLLVEDGYVNVTHTSRERARKERYTSERIIEVPLTAAVQKAIAATTQKG